MQEKQNVPPLWAVLLNKRRITFWVYLLCKMCLSTQQSIFNTIHWTSYSMFNIIHSASYPFRYVDKIPYLVPRQKMFLLILAKNRCFKYLHQLFQYKKCFSRSENLTKFTYSIPILRHVYLSFLRQSIKWDDLKVAVSGQNDSGWYVSRNSYIREQ